MLVLSWDTSKIQPLRDGGLERALFRAVSKAGGDAIRAARVASSRTVRFRKRFRVSKVNQGLPIRFPRGPRVLDDLEWRITPSGETMPVSAFPGARQVKLGASVGINRQRKTIPGAFVAKMKSGHVGVFKRRGSKRLAIDELFSTKISDVFRDGGMIPAVHTRAQVVFSASFARLLPLEIARGR